MSERAIFEYLVNSVWQVPVLLLGTALAVRVLRPRPMTQHVLWCGTLLLGVLLPLRGIEAPIGQPVQAIAAAKMMPSPAPDALQVQDVLPVAMSAPAEAVRWSERVRTLAGLRPERLQLSQRTVNALLGLYGLSALWSMAGLVRGWRVARKFAEAAEVSVPTGFEASLLRACARRLRLAETRIPEVRFLGADDATPMVVGIRQPVLLLPGNMRQENARFDDRRLAAVFSHELAHVRRRDFLANLLARLVALPVAYHPATHALQRRIRLSRELICDAEAAAVLSSKTTYAQALLDLAGRMTVPHVEAASLFDTTRSSLEERIMQLTQPVSKNTVLQKMMRLSTASALGAVVAATAAFHIQPSISEVYASESRRMVRSSEMTHAEDAERRVLQTRVELRRAMTLESRSSVVRMSQASAQAAPSPNTLPPPPAPAVPAAPRAPAAPLLPSAPPAPAHPAPPMERLAPLPPAAPPAPPHARVFVDGQERDTTPEEQQKLDKEFSEMREHIRKQTRNLTENLRNQNFAAQFKNFSSPEFKKQMDEMRETLKSPEMKKQFAALKALNSDAMEAQIRAEMSAVQQQLNSREFRQQIERAQREAQLMANGPEVRKQMEEARKQLEAATSAIAEARRQVQDAAVRKQLDEAQRRIDDATRSVHP